MRKTASKPKVILGRDTRESSPWIAATLAAGLRETGTLVESAGVITTPAVAFLARTHGFQAGVVISASHNPWRDNGIKLFGGDGFKLADAVELAMEDEILHHAAKIAAPDPASLPPVEDNPALQADYIQFLIDCVPGLSLAGLRIVADCANGAAAAVAPELFRRLERRTSYVTLLNIAPNGRNINLGCGALHPNYVAAEDSRARRKYRPYLRRRRRPLHAGRRAQNIVNGDAILLMAARDLKTRGLLTGDLVVATTMSNMGLEAALKRSGIRMLRAPVGDRYVLEQMQKNDAALGGEQSGHILLPHLATTGDGLLTSLVVLDLIARSRQEHRRADRGSESLSAGHRERKSAREEAARIDSLGRRRHPRRRRGVGGFGPRRHPLQRHRGPGPRDDRGRKRRRDEAPRQRNRRRHPRGTGRVTRQNKTNLMFHLYCSNSVEACALPGSESRSLPVKQDLEQHAVVAGCPRSRF